MQNYAKCRIEICVERRWKKEKVEGRKNQRSREKGKVRGSESEKESKRTRERESDLIFIHDRRQRKKAGKTEREGGGERKKELYKQNKSKNA